MGCPGKSSAEVDLSDIIEHLQSYFMSGNAEQNIFPSAESIPSCADFLDEFADEAVQPCYDRWSSGDFHDNSQVYVDLTKSDKNVKLVSNV